MFAFIHVYCSDVLWKPSFGSMLVKLIVSVIGYLQGLLLTNVREREETLPQVPKQRSAIT